MKKKWYIPGIILSVWMVLLFLLVAAERVATDASIQTMEDAIWYSVVTLTTVGYGDVYPVTALGRCIGTVLVLLSTGLITFLLGCLISLMMGHVWPLMRLRFLRGKEWYIFSEQNAESNALATNLQKENPQGIFVFQSKAENASDFLTKGNIFYPEAGLAELLKLKKNSTYKYFIVEQEGYSKIDKAIEEGCKGEIYCHTEVTPDELPLQVHLFDRYDCCSRLYWRHKPLKQQDKKVVLIGSGKYATALMERALLNNLMSVEQWLEYHLFGNWQDFQCNHCELKKMVNVDRAGTHNDTVYFHKDKWNTCRELLESADRVILCADCERENIEILNCLKQYYNLHGALHIRATQKLDVAYTFGAAEDLFVPELVMGTKLNKIAMLMNEIYCKSVGAKATDWQSLSEFARQSNIAAAEHLLVKIQILLGDEVRGKISRASYADAYVKYLERKPEMADFFRKLEHERWVRFHLLNNWKYGPVKNHAEKIHPLLVPFETLSQEEQAKDDFAWELLKDVSEQL